MALYTVTVLYQTDEATLMTSMNICMVSCWCYILMDYEILELRYQHISTLIQCGYNTLSKAHGIVRSRNFTQFSSASATPGPGRTGEKNSIRKTERRVEDKEKKKDKRRTDNHKCTCMCLFNMLLANHFNHSYQLSVIVEL